MRLRAMLSDVLRVRSAGRGRCDERTASVGVQGGWRQQSEGERDQGKGERASADGRAGRRMSKGQEQSDETARDELGSQGRRGQERAWNARLS